MRNQYGVLVTFFVISSLAAVSTFAQEQTADAAHSEVSTSTSMPTAKASVEKKAEVNKQPAKKMVQDATITLQTTITGNQEQPRVLYILPWQSPSATDVDFESLDNEQKAVFGHVEREELRRELESSDVIQ